MGKVADAVDRARGLLEPVLSDHALSQHEYKELLEELMADFDGRLDAVKNELGEED